MNLNATLIVQIVVFLALWWFTARFVWPPITKALDERSLRITEGLAAADKARTELAAAEKRVEQELKTARAGAAEVRGTAEKQAAADHAEAIRLSAQGEAEAEKLRAEASRIRFEVEAAGQRAINEAANLLSSDQISLQTKMALLKEIGRASCRERV